MKFLCDDHWLNEEEFAEWLADLSIHDLAEMTCESIPYTLQMMELSKTLAAKAAILYIETRAE